MSRHTNRNIDLTQQIYNLLISKIEDYQTTVQENQLLFNQLLDLIKSKIQNHSLEVTNQLISRIDDLTEDIVNENVTYKLLIQSLSHNTSLTLSSREPERIQRLEQWNRVIRENNLIPLLFLLYTNQTNNSSSY